MVDRIQISIPKDMRKELDRYLAEVEMTRSKFFIIAAWQYMNELRKKKIREALESGYEQMKDESETIARETLGIQTKTIESL